MHILLFIIMMCIVHGNVPFYQMCVADCPGYNEVGIRANPVCVESVVTSRFDNVENDFTLKAVRNQDIACIYTFVTEILKLYTHTHTLATHIHTLLKLNR